jgi:antitoxin ParD1/3/4
MNVSFPIPKELESYVQGQIQSGTYNTVADYFLSLLNQDRQRREAQAKLVSLLQEGLNGCDLNIIHLLSGNRKPILIEILPELLPTRRS